MIQLTRDIRKIIFSFILILGYIFSVVSESCGIAKTCYYETIEFWKSGTAKLDSGITLTKLFERYFGD